MSENLGQQMNKKPPYELIADKFNLNDSPTIEYIHITDDLSTYCYNVFEGPIYEETNINITYPILEHGLPHEMLTIIWV